MGIRGRKIEAVDSAEMLQVKGMLVTLLSTEKGDEKKLTVKLFSERNIDIVNVEMMLKHLGESLIENPFLAGQKIELLRQLSINIDNLYRETTVDSLHHVGALNELIKVVLNWFEVGKVVE